MTYSPQLIHCAFPYSVSFLLRMLCTHLLHSISLPKLPLHLYRGPLLNDALRGVVEFCLSFVSKVADKPASLMLA